ncbi:universal stress protein [Naasia sp. SYSU D00057]|uniref:universal stress protein n=1 Tax=Naasia sp. SYSU D00057 TaxID=2817380 RepID=UPI001B307D1B|nr:universal stress protein [Naasia sp. SYSU D00057]
MGIRRVTVGVDGSPGSRAAIDWAVERSRHTGMTLELLSVIPDTRGDSEYEAAVRRYSEGNLADCISAVKAGAPGLAVTSAIRAGSPTAELVRASEETDLLVVGTDKSSKARRLVYGTVPLRLAALSACPLVVVPRSWRPGRESVVLAVGDEETHPNTVAFAAAEAEARDLALDLVHVWSAAPNYPTPMYLTDYPWEHVVESSRRVLEDARAEVVAAHPDLTVTTHLEEGPTIPRLVEAAENAQLLVVGRGGRGIFRDILQLGSVAHDVLLNPPAPIAVVPSERKQHLPRREDRRPTSSVAG